MIRSNRTSIVWSVAATLGTAVLWPMTATINLFRLAVVVAFCVGLSEPAVAIPLDGGPEYTPPGAGTETTSGQPADAGGFTIEEAGYDLGQTGALYFGVRADTFVNGYSMDGLDISGDEVFRFASKTANTIVYTGETTMVTTLNGTFAIPTRMTFTFTGTGVTVEDESTQSLNNVNKGDVGALWHVQSSDFSVNVLIEAEVPTGYENAGNYEPANDLFNRIETEHQTQTSFDWAFYYYLCGNGVVDLDTEEQCDDGNAIAGDCCDTACQLPTCAIGAAQANLDYNEKKAGKEKMKIQLKQLDAETTTADFGDPVAGSTSVAMCILDDAGALVQSFYVDRAGDSCSGKPCWKENGTTGFGYKDKLNDSDGISKIGFKSGPASKGKADGKGKNNSTKGQTSLPTGVVTKLNGNTAPTVMIVTSDGFCAKATMTAVKKDEADVRYSAQKK